MSTPLMHVMIVTGDKATTRFEQWRQTESESVSHDDLTNTLGQINALHISDYVKVYCSAALRPRAIHNKSIKSLMTALGLKPYACRGTAIICFRDGVCRNGHSAISIARQWHTAYADDNFQRMSDIESGAALETVDEPGTTRMERLCGEVLALREQLGVLPELAEHEMEQ